MIYLQNAETVKDKAAIYREEVILSLIIIRLCDYFSNWLCDCFSNYLFLPDLSFYLIYLQNAETIKAKAAKYREEVIISLIIIRLCDCFSNWLCDCFLTIYFYLIYLQHKEELKLKTKQALKKVSISLSLSH